jgi:signal transduction histidine kinase
VTALQLIFLASQAIYVLLFLIVGTQALRRPQRATWDIALFFGASALIVLELQFVALTGATSPLLSAIVGTLALALPYLLLRLVADFAHVPLALLRGAEVGLILIAVALFLAPEPTPLPLVLVLVAYFVVLAAYGALAFVRAARRSVGVTRRRLEAVAAGTVFLGADVVTAGLGALLSPAEVPLVTAIGQLLGLLSAIAYFVGFAPPRILRRAWQEPELRAFLQSAASLPRLPQTAAIVRALQDGAAAAIGARAAIGLYDPTLHVLRFHDPHSVLPNEVGPGDFLVWRVFESQRAEYFPDAARAHAKLAPAYREQGVASLLISPISAGDQRLGALEVYTDRPLVFSEDDLSLTRLFADQAAVILESRALIDEAARVRAHEEAARLKEDFLSAAAHDLKTPLTTLVAQAQFLERRAEAEPSAPADVPGIKRIVREAKRLSGLVVELLDASRLEQGRLVGEREPIDLVELAREVASRDIYGSHLVTVSADAPIVGSYDPRRIGQVIENLVENAVKYSPEASEVRVVLAQRNGNALIDVSDRGIGIPVPDVPHVFDRFHRAANVDDRRFAGMGLGLFICKGIVEQHGGRIWVESAVGTGSTFHVALPVGGRG